MSFEPVVAPAVPAAAAPAAGGPAGLGIVQRDDGVYFDVSVAPASLVATVDNLFRSSFFLGLNYPLLMRALFGVGPEIPRPLREQGWVRFAKRIMPFDPQRRELYRAVKVTDGRAEYYFEPVFLPNPAEPQGAGLPARLDADEFVADLWGKGIRFGIDIDLVRQTIAGGVADRLVVARRLDPTPGIDAHVIEVSDDIHRSNAPRRLANGRLDLQAFQNRFPQVKGRLRLLKKAPPVMGTRGVELSGQFVEPSVPVDLDLKSYAGPGTMIERTLDGEYLVSLQPGFLMVDPKTSQITVGHKIVSHEGVSARTTGNLMLTGDFEEFGEVQENRVIEGEGITLHADVFGKIVSRGGTIALHHNLVGGSAANKRGDIVVHGVASGATLQTLQGTVSLKRAENCVVSGTKVRIEHAVNCDIIADEVAIEIAEGCAVAGRAISIDSAGPRRQSEMVVFVQVADSARVDEVIALTNQRLEQLAALEARHKAEMDAIAAQPDVARYLRIASKVRKKELTLTPEQVPQFQKMAVAVGPALKDVSRIQLTVKSVQEEMQTGRALVARLEEQRASATVSRVQLKALHGDTQVRILKYLPDGNSTYALPVREIRTRLRSPHGERLHTAASGEFAWSSDGAPAAS